LPLPNVTELILPEEISEQRNGKGVQSTSGVPTS
jgi:hypothetical protein